jgi:hypothetical protein
MKAMASKGRRGFLLAAGFGGAGAVVAVATVRKATPGAAKQAAAAETAQGYRVTAHIEKYYNTTKI